MNENEPPLRRIRWKDVPKPLRDRILGELHRRRYEAGRMNDRETAEAWAAAIDALDPPSNS